MRCFQQKITEKTPGAALPRAQKPTAKDSHSSRQHDSFGLHHVFLQSMNQLPIFKCQNILHTNLDLKFILEKEISGNICSILGMKSLRGNTVRAAPLSSRQRGSGSPQLSNRLLPWVHGTWPVQLCHLKTSYQGEGRRTSEEGKPQKSVKMAREYCVIDSVPSFLLNIFCFTSFIGTGSQLTIHTQGNEVL